MTSDQVIQALAALAQETRLAVFRLLVQVGSGGLPAGAIAQRLSVPNATLSFHLKELSHAGLVRARNESRFIYYAADYAAMSALVEFLTDNCCGGAACMPEPKHCKTKEMT